MGWQAHSLAASGGCWGAAAGAVAKLAASRPSAAQQVLLYGVHVLVRPFSPPLHARLLEEVLGPSLQGAAQIGVEVSGFMQTPYVKIVKPQIVAAAVPAAPTVLLARTSAALPRFFICDPTILMLQTFSYN